jgi:hypothetical protein
MLLKKWLSGCGGWLQQMVKLEFIYIRSPKLKKFSHCCAGLVKNVLLTGSDY